MAAGSVTRPGHCGQPAETGSTTWRVTVTRNLVALMCLLVTVCAGCQRVQSERARQPAFKGMELYSWRPEGGDWHFSLLVGTNREKAVSEITKPQNTITDIPKLKARLSTLARGESVLWRNLAKEPVPSSMVTDLQGFCEKLGVNLAGPRSSGQLLIRVIGWRSTDAGPVLSVV